MSGVRVTAYENGPSGVVMVAINTLRTPPVCSLEL